MAVKKVCNRRRDERSSGDMKSFSLLLADLFSIGVQDSAAWAQEGA